jgi:hypothetical protein
MGGFQGGEPPVPITPDVPVPSFQQQAQQTAAGLQQGGFWADLGAVLAVLRIPSVTNAMSLLLGMVDWVLTMGVTLLTKAQGANNPMFFDFLAAMLSDLLGVEFGAGDMQTAYGRGGNVQAMQAAGGKLFDLLAGEFGTTGSLTPESGIAAAKAFIGYMLSFSVREANVATMVQLLPDELRFMEGLRHYGTVMARNLGLGRLARRALQPLIQTLIADPMQWSLNAQYRPKILSESLAVHALLRGQINQDTFNRLMAWTGYDDDAIEAVQEENYTRPPASDYYMLQRYGAMDADTMLESIRNTGTSQGLAQVMVETEQYREADTEVSAFMGELRTQRVAGYIDAPTFSSLVDGLPISDQHKTWFKNLVGQQVEWPRSHLTQAEGQSAYVAGIIDLSDYQNILITLGYSDSDQDVLVNLTLLKLSKEAYTAAKAEWTYLKQVAAAKKKGEAPPPAPPGIGPPPTI